MHNACTGGDCPCVVRSVVRNAWNCNGSVTMWTVWDGVVDTTVRGVGIMCVRGRVLAQIGKGTG